MSSQNGCDSNPCDQPRTAYDAADVRGNRAGWQPHLYSPNDAMSVNYSLVLSRSRDAFRNNSWIRKSVRTLLSSEVGDGIRAKNMCEDVDYRNRWQDLWDEWTEFCDISGVSGLDQIVDMCVSDRIVAGGAFIRYVRSRYRRGSKVVPLSLQTLSVEQVPLHSLMPNRAGNKTLCGLEFTPSGRLWGYHVYLEHPGEFSAYSGSAWVKKMQTVFIPVRDMTQHYMPQRVGMVRESPSLATALDRARSSEDYDRCELDRKKIKSMITGTLEREEYTEKNYQFDPISGAPMNPDVAVPQVVMRSGMMLSLLPGEKANMFNADNTADGFDDYVRYQNLALTASIGVPYELGTGDFSQINDRVVRTILDDMRRDINKTLRLYTIPQVVRRTSLEFSDILQLTGILSRPDYFTNRAKYHNIVYTPQPFPYVHPTQDRQGVRMDLDMGLTNRTRECQKRRIDRAVLDSETEEEMQDEESKGLKYDFRFTEFEKIKDEEEEGEDKDPSGDDEDDDDDDDSGSGKKKEDEDE